MALGQAPALFRRLFERLRDERSFFKQVGSQFEQFPQYYTAVEIPATDLAPSHTLGGRSMETAAYVAFAFALTLEQCIGQEMPAPKLGTLDRIVGRFADVPREQRAVPYIALWDQQESRLNIDFPGLVFEIRRAVTCEASRLDDSDQQLVFAGLGVFFTLYYQSRDEISEFVTGLMR